MASPGVNIEDARAGEERYLTSLRKVMLDLFGKTPERVAWCEAVLEAEREYGDISPYEAAVYASKTGDRKMYERAVADYYRIDSLAEAAFAEK